MELSKTIVMWGEDDLLTTYVKSILESQSGWKVVSLSSSETKDNLEKVVHIEKPSAVVMLKGDCPCMANLPVELIQAYPNIKVITLNHRTNFIEVFSKENLLITSAADLISAIDTR